MFSKWLEEETNLRGWSHSELARRAELSQVQVSGVIAGQRKPGCEFCIKIAQAFELPPVLILVKAGILPPQTSPPDDPSLAEALEILQNLLPSQRKEALRYLRYLYQSSQDS